MPKYNDTWDLETIFPGGSTSPQMEQFFKQVENDLADLEERWANFPQKLDRNTQPIWVETIQLMQNLEAKLYEVGSFVYCLLAQDVTDEKAHILLPRYQDLEAKNKVLLAKFAALFGEQDDNAWADLIKQPNMTEIAFRLNNDREIARKKMAPEKEALVEELGTNGYSAWENFYERIAGQLKAEFDENGQTKSLSMGQLASKMAHPKRDLRRQAFEKLESTWQGVEQETAMILNNLAGYRWTTYQHRGWDDIVEEALLINRLTRQTLDTMWQVVGEESKRLAPYFEAKAKLLGIDRLSWFDIHAPVGTTDKRYSYDEASDFVIDQLGKFSPDMADFSQMAIEKRWIEAADRSGKRAGGFSTGFPVSQQTRIFMTFTGTYDNLSTLAHELGHSYHTWVMRDLPRFIREYPMTLAETASTFNETVVASGALKNVQSDAEKLYLLDVLLSNAVAFFMNLYSRYIFELSFYDKRKNGFVDVDTLKDLMLAAQRQAYHGLLADDGYHPLFWASKMHFYFANEPFYNFPYTYGFLFSNGIYHHARSNGDNFADKYVELLRDTGRMTCEDVAKKHLGADLTQPDFWRNAVNQVLKYVDEFVELANR